VGAQRIQKPIELPADPGVAPRRGVSGSEDEDARNLGLEVCRVVIEMDAGSAGQFDGVPGL